MLGYHPSPDVSVLPFPPDETQYIGKCEHGDCTEDAVRYIKAQQMFTAPVSGAKKVISESGYVCGAHVNEIRDSEWAIVLNRPANNVALEQDDE